MERQSLVNDGLHPTPTAVHNVIQHLNAMHTRQLIDRLRGIRAGHGVMNRLYGEATPEQREVLEAEANMIKDILATREHVPGKAEAKQIRQAKQKAKQAR